MDADWPVLDLSALRKQPALLASGQPACVLYASGSAGKPKGVIIEQAALLNRLRWMQEAFPLSGKDKVLHKNPFSSGAAVWEMLWPLTAGAQLFIASPEEREDGRQLAEIIEQFGITTMHFTPSLLEMFLAGLGERRCHSLRRVFCSGEVLTRPLQTRFFEKINSELINLYGLAEASIVSCWRCSLEGQEDPVPVGRPISNVQVSILDSEGIPVPIGVTGKLYIGGTGLALTSISKGEPVNEKSVPHPWKENELLYPSGDLGRYAADGIIEYRGRAEHQVKLQGLKIELQDIETILLSHPQLRHATVLSNADLQQRQPSLVAVYTTADKKSVPASELQAYLLGSMPEFMVPHRFLFLEEWPLTVEGKTDRLGLNSRARWLEMDLELVGQRPAYAAPRTPTEVELAELWSALLLVGKPSIDDDFFDLGGHSLLAMELLAKIQERFSLKLSVTQFFEQNTIRKIALAIDKVIQLRMEMEGDLLEEEGSQITKI
jgi:acyl-coenzyme A synthetase/AMP-(fatty) acid ligase/acyl carrier protein